MGEGEMGLNWERWGVVIPAYGGEENWRATRVANPDIFRTPNGKWRMYYNGGNSHIRVGKYGAETIGFAELSNDGDRPIWRDFGGNPVMILHEGAPIEAAIDPAMVFWNRHYLLFVSAWRQEETCFIGLAVSKNGLRFNSYGKISVGRAPEVVVKDGRLFLFYVMDEEETYRIHLAVSSKDGLLFKEHPRSPIFCAIPGTWEGQSVTTPRIFFEDSWYYMVYSGDPDDKDYPPYFGLARSSDLINWERWSGNPFFERGRLGEPDEGAIWWGELFRWKRGYVLYYEGYSQSPEREKYGGGVSQICAAYLKLPSLASLFE